MINKEHFTNGLIQVAIVLSLIRTDLEVYLIPSSIHLPSHHASQHQRHETIFDSIADYSRNDGHVGWSGSPNPKLIDDDRFWSLSSLFGDLHSLTNYRRFDGIDTNIHTWLVSDTGPARITPGTIPSSSDNSELATGTSHDAVQPVLPTLSSNEPNAATNDATSPLSDPGSELTKEDMELIDILYMQDIDIGIGREVFDSSYRQDEQNKNQSKLQTKDDSDTNETKSADNIESSEAYPPLDLAGHYVVDGETGELVFVSSPLQRLTEHQPQSNDTASDIPDTPQIELLEPIYTNNNAASELTQPTISFERQSSVDQRWNDILNILGLPSTPTVTSDMMSGISPLAGHYDTSSLLVQNASMGSAMELSNNDSFTMEPSNNISFTVTPTDFSLSSTAFYPNYTSGGLDNVSMALFVPDTTTLTSPNQSFTGLPNSSFGIDQLSFGLFNNLSLVPPVFGVESGENEATVNFSSSSTTDLYGSHESTMIYNGTAGHTQIPLAPESSINFNNSNVLLDDILQSEMLQSDLVDDLDLSDIIDDEEMVSTSATRHVIEEDWFSDSAVSSMDSPVHQNYTSAMQDVGDEGGATGGVPKYEVYEAKSESSEFYESSSSFPFNYQQQTFSGASNYSDMQPSSVTATKNIHHNHTYPLPDGRKSREELEEEARREKEDRATRSRDEKRAKALKIPMSMDEIIDSSVEQFTELVSHYRLTDAQQQLARDIRRRGKNKMAAQNCRKRKMDVIQNIETEVVDLRRERDRLRRARTDLDRSAAVLKDKFKRLESELFRRLQDESGREYDPSLFSLLHTDDGGLFIVPRSNTTVEQRAADQSHDEKKGHKRKSKRKD